MTNGGAQIGIGPKPNPDSLSKYVSRQIDDAMLADISTADYGWRADEHLAALRALRDRGDVPNFDGTPQEVLELIRNSEPDIPGWRPGNEGKRGHWMRLFCGISLLRMSIEYGPERLIGFDGTISGMITSLKALGLSWWPEAQDLLTALVLPLEKGGMDDDLTMVIVAKLYCAMHQPDADDVRMTSIFDLLVPEPASGRSIRGLLPAVAAAIEYSGRRASWESIAAEMLAIETPLLSIEVREHVIAIASDLIGTARD